MRKFTVDFKTADIGVIGRKGEHNYPVLEFKLDEDFKNCDFIVVELSINGRKIPAESIEPTGETLTFKLTKQLSEAGHHHAQLVGYVVEPESAEPQEIMKSPVIHFCIEQSIGGVEQEADSKPNLLDRILTKVHELLKKAHTHKYSNTLDALRCPVLEDPFTQMIDDHYLKFNGSALRFVSDGAVVKRVSEVEKDGQAYLRLWLHDGRSVIVGSEIPDYIDIPVSAVISTESEDDNGLILNGSELELPSGGGGGSSVTVDADGYIVIG